MPDEPSPFYEPDENLWNADIAAQQAIKWCRTKLKLRDTPVPVPVDVWIEKPMGMVLTVTDLTHLGPDTEGAVIMEKYEIQIEQNLAEDDGRFRFACAHELGHMVLHRNAKKIFQEHTHIGRIYHDLYEKQADRFASVTLMPLHSMFGRVFQLAAKHKKPRVEFLNALMAEGPSPQKLWADVVLPDMESYFGLSRRVVLERFASLNLRREKRPFLPQSVAAQLGPTTPEKP
jgi:hypothetical protein